jgi:PAS domain S-box-containing protein
VFTAVQVIFFTFVLGWYFVAQETLEARASLTKLGSTLSKNLARQSEWLIVSRDREGLRRLLSGVLESGPDIVYAAVKSRNGDILASVGQEAHSSDVQEFGHVVNTRVAQSVDETVDMTAESGGRQEPIGWVSLYISLASVKKRMDDIKNMAFGAVFLIIVVAIQSSFAFTKFFIVMPLRPLLKGIESIIKGDITYKISRPPKDEFGDIAISFNVMVKSLETTYVSRDYLGNILHSVAGALMVLSPEGVILMVNRAAMEFLGYSQDELLGQSLPALLAEPAAAGDYLQDKKNVFLAFLTKEGKRIGSAFSVAAMKDESGALTGYVILARGALIK